MKLDKIIKTIDSFAPFFLQEEYDNSGLQFGDEDSEINKILISLDLSQEVVEESIERRANLIITHHPPIFKPISSITRTKNCSLYTAIVNGVNVLSAHTNYDLSKDGLNDYVGKLLRIKKSEPIIRSKEKVFKLVTYVPQSFEEKVKNALFENGAGRIGNYSETSFTSKGTGTFKPQEGSKPFIGKINERANVEEVKIETVISERFLQKALYALKKVHPYEEPAIDIFEINYLNEEGVGLIGSIDFQGNINEFALYVKKALNTKYIRIVKTNNKIIRKVALCTGSGSSLIENLSSNTVDVFITGDTNYHQALKAKENGINLIDIDHFETEKFFPQSIYKKLIEAGIKKNLLYQSKVQKPVFKIV